MDWHHEILLASLPRGGPLDDGASARKIMDVQSGIKSKMHQDQLTLGPDGAGDKSLSHTLYFRGLLVQASYVLSFI